MADFNKEICDLSENLVRQKEIDTAKAWSRLSRKIAFDLFRVKAWNTARTAAAILLPAFLLHQYVVGPMLKKSEPQEMITITSAPGMVTKAVLPDGSEVWLNALSSLTYPRRFTEKERAVRLSGEAYFKVVSDKKHRFNVETRKMTVSACGTEFNVNAYESETSHEVTLARGQVEVSSQTGSKATEALAVNEKAVLRLETGHIHVVTADPYVETAWKDGKMVFRREKLDKIVTRLSRKFGVDIRLEGDKLKEYEYTATFTDETLEDILDLLKRSAPITYSISKQRQLNNETFTRKEVIIKSR
ncbi:FecR family protein [Proteiniphilum sp. X52]|uniref:FecR family protein n=1 Tax=Proteiniphilum sp. X52 TaxID=2382159 RepID=UPI000F0A19D9|nr:FecR domain-containing protein [Proteiniphilum sp. X52]RNC63928.1 FecR family protein [Proteiniphilum sp. X52]